VAESYQKHLLGYDLKQNKVVQSIDLGDIMGRYAGVASSFEGIESVSMIPKDLRG
jgi:hypothetical protein